MTLIEKIRPYFVKKLQHYTSIDDLPIYNWFKIHKTNDLKHLLISHSKVGFSRSKELNIAFGKIYDEFIDTFGVNDDLRKIMELKRDIRVLEIDCYLHNDLSKQTFIDIKESELKELIEGKTKTKLNDVKGYVEKYMGFHLDERTSTVKDYYTYKEIMNREAKKQPNG